MVRRLLPLLVVVLFVLIAGTSSGQAPPTVAAHPTDGSCTHCHEDPHAKAPPSGAPVCTSCHTTEAWVPTTFTLALHAKTRLPLEGLHTEVACAECHADHALTGLPLECAGCHVDRHRGKLGDQCQDCHTVQGFTPVEGFDHLAKTGFALTGHHDGRACEDCHEGANERAMIALGKSSATCTTCHVPGHGDLGADCQTCHEDAHATFAVARADFDHASTGFPLEREHKSVACDTCHPAGARPPVSRCASCHVDPHSGQLGQSCGDCHEPDRWRLARFDHDLTSWALRGRHFTTSCAACHANQQWVGLRTECYDCHAFEALKGPPSIPAHVSGAADCSDCHTSAWSWSF